MDEMVSFVDIFNFLDHLKKCILEGMLKEIAEIKDNSYRWALERHFLNHEKWIYFDFEFDSMLGALKCRIEAKQHFGSDAIQIPFSKNHEIKFDIYSPRYTSLKVFPNEILINLEPDYVDVQFNLFGREFVYNFVKESFDFDIEGPENTERMPTIIFDGAEDDKGRNQ